MKSQKTASGIDHRAGAVLVGLFLLATLLPASAILFVVDGQYKSSVLHRDTVVVRAAAAQIGGAIRGVQRQLESGASFLAGSRGDLPSIRSFLGALREANPALLSVAFLTSTDVVEARSPGGGAVDFTKAGGLMPVFQQVGTLPAALLSAGVSDGNGDMLSAVLSLAVVPAHLGSLAELSESRVFLLSADKRLLISDDEGAPTALFRRGPSGGFRLVAAIDGRGRGTGWFTTEAPVRGTSWVLLLATPQRGLLSSSFSLVLLVGSALMVLLFALLSISMLRRVWVGPLRARSQRFEEMAEALQNTVRQKEMLLRETHHRVKNDLQILSSMFNLSLREADGGTGREILVESQNRVRAISLIHELLYQSPNLAGVSIRSYVEELVRRIEGSLVRDHDAVTIVSHVGDYHFDPETSVACGLLLNELLTNSLKYAFPLGGSGEIVVRIERISSGRYLLEVGDDGVGLPPALASSPPQSLGMRLVRALSEQLGGEVSVQTDPGTSWQIRFDATEVAMSRTKAAAATAAVPDPSSEQT